MIKFRILLFPVLLGLSYPAFSQVYKCTDAEGNVTFGDTQSADCKEVHVEETNVAVPVNVPANTTPTPEPEVVKTERPSETTSEKDYDDDDGYRSDSRRRARHHTGRRSRRLRR